MHTSDKLACMHAEEAAPEVAEIKPAAPPPVLPPAAPLAETVATPQLRKWFGF